jgi:hypothetical protein
MRDLAPPFRRYLLAAAVVAVMAATGCTMCPDPYDYTGPVPNGSPPQNDFQARSNGILPIGAASKPFPPVVKASPAEKPTPAETKPEAEAADAPLVAEAEDDVLRLSAEESAAAAPAEEAGRPLAAASEVADSVPSGGDQPPALVAAGEAALLVESQGPADDRQEPPAIEQAPPRVAKESPLRETPGWRARR